MLTLKWTVYIGITVLMYCLSKDKRRSQCLFCFFPGHTLYNMVRQWQLLFPDNSLLFPTCLNEISPGMPATRLRPSGWCSTLHAADFTYLWCRVRAATSTHLWRAKAAFSNHGGGKKRVLRIQGEWWYYLLAERAAAGCKMLSCMFSRFFVSALDQKRRYEQRLEGWWDCAY